MKAPRLGPQPENAARWQNESPALRRDLNLVDRIGLHQARESRDSPRLKAFCRVAPSDRFRDRAMLDARVFFLAEVFKVRTSAAVHVRRFDLLAI
jgi:hypothetical protein